jgi:hypothetical protein
MYKMGNYICFAELKALQAQRTSMLDEHLDADKMAASDVTADFTDCCQYQYFQPETSVAEDTTELDR